MVARRFGTTLTLIVIFSAVLPVAIFSIYLVNDIYQLTRSSAERELNVQANSLANLIRQELDLIDSKIATLAASPDMPQATYVSPFGKTGEGHRAFEFMRDFVEASSLVSGVYLVDSEPRVVDAFPPAAVDIVPDFLWSDVKEHLKKSFSKDEKMTLAKDFAHGDFTRASLQQDSKHRQNIKQVVNPSSFASDTGYAIVAPIVNALGQNRGALIAIIPFKKIGDMAAPKLASHVDFTIEGEKRVRLWRSTKGDASARISSRAHLPLANRDKNSKTYEIVFSESEAVRMKPVNVTIRNLILGLALAALILAGFAVFVARWLTSPLNVMRGVVERYAKGSYEPQAISMVFQEFQDFKVTLEQMGSEIMRQINQLLDARKALAIQNDELVKSNVSLTQMKERLELILEGTVSLASTRELADALKILVANVQKVVQFQRISLVRVIKQTTNAFELTAVDQGVLQMALEERSTDVPMLYFREFQLSEIIELIDTPGFFMPLSGDEQDQIYLCCVGKRWAIMSVEDQNFLRTLSVSLTNTISNIRFFAQREKSAMLKMEMEAAHSVQQALLPDKNLEATNVAYYGSLVAASNVGGDWYGFHEDPVSGCVYMYIGDVTGHGIPSALVTGVVCGAIQGAQKSVEKLGNQFQLQIPEKARLEALAHTLNDLLLDTGAKSGRLMTMCFICLDAKSGKLYYLNAGHNHPYLISAKDLTVRSMISTGYRLGHTATAAFAVKEFDLEPGDTVFMYTDGLIENHGPQETDILSIRDLKVLLRGRGTPQEIIEKVRSAATDRWQEVPYEDDVTMLVVRWEGADQQKLRAVS